jgi:hypothetical protein
MFDRPRTSLGILALLLFMPQAVFVIGDYLAIGVRFPFFRLQLAYQSVNPAMSFITIVRELQYIATGAVGSASGRTAIATFIWLAALVFLLLAAALVISWQLLGNFGHVRYPGPLVLGSGVLFLVWGMVQYGPLLFGTSGYSIPVGVPILWYCGWQFMQAGRGESE